MKNKFGRLIICLALSLLFYGATIVRAAESTNKDETNTSLGKTNIEIKNKSDINSEQIVEVFNYGQKNLSITQSDIELLAKLVYAESRGEPFEGKVGVASVVLNRVLSPNFPKSIKGVVFQANAFSCVVNNDIVAYPNQDCYDAVYEAIKGQDPTNEALYFYNPTLATCSWMQAAEKTDIKTIGQHVFFKSED